MEPISQENAAQQDRLYADILGRIRLLPEVREGRVREIRSLIEAGRYRIDPRRIAERMLLQR